MPWLALQWRDVITLQAPGLAALDASVAVTLEDGTPHGGPAAGVQAGVLSAQVLLFRISSLSGRRAAQFRVFILIPS